MGIRELSQWDLLGIELFGKSGPRRLSREERKASFARLRCLLLKLLYLWVRNIPRHARNSAAAIVKKLKSLELGPEPCAVPSSGLGVAFGSGVYKFAPRVRSVEARLPVFAAGPAGDRAQTAGHSGKGPRGIGA